jgi:hypothetical protein
MLRPFSLTLSSSLLLSLAQCACLSLSLSLSLSSSPLSHLPSSRRCLHQLHAPLSSPLQSSSHSSSHPQHVLITAACAAHLQLAASVSCRADNLHPHRVGDCLSRSLSHFLALLLSCSLALAPRLSFPRSLSLSLTLSLSLSVASIESHRVSELVPPVSSHCLIVCPAAAACSSFRVAAAQLPQ